MSTIEVRGLPACSCLAEWVPAFEKMIGHSPRLFQLAGDAKASAGFHKRGGSVDYEPLSDDELRIARNMGGAAWNRWWHDSDGDPNFHCHIRLNGCPHNTIAQPQVADLNEGRDGTGPLYDNAGVPDNGPRDGVHWPLRTWRQGIDWAHKQEDDMFEDADRAMLTRIDTRLAALQRVEKLRFQISQTNDAATKAALTKKLTEIQKQIAED